MLPLALCGLFLACGNAETPTAAGPPEAAAANPEPAGDRVAEVKALHAEVGSTPEAALKVWFDVLLSVSTSTDSAHEEALAYLTIPLKEDPIWRERESGRFFLDRIRRDPHILRSYAQGTAPENGYTLPKNWKLAIAETRDAGPRGTAVFVISSGADSPRPIYMKRSTKTGLWYVAEYANVYVGIRAPVDPNAETFE